MVYLKHCEKNNCDEFLSPKRREKLDSTSTSESGIKLPRKRRKKLNKNAVPEPEEKSTTCQFCGITFKRNFSLEIHLRKLHEEEANLPKFNTNDIYLTEDIIREQNYSTEDLHEMHIPINDIYQCLVCSKYVASLTFIYHLRLHTGETVGFCNKCNRGFNTRLAYQLHMKKHRDGQNEGVIKQGRKKVKPEDYVNCDKCGRLFKGVSFF